MLHFSVFAMALSIQEQAKHDAQQILASFGKTLGKVKLPQARGEKVTHNAGMRVEGMGKTVDTLFRNGMLRNAPKQDGEHFLVETKEW